MRLDGKAARAGNAARAGSAGWAILLFLIFLPAFPGSPVRPADAEAIYAFGSLAPGLSGLARRDLLQSSQPDLETALTLANPALRLAVVRAIGRIYERPPGDPPIDEKLGNALISAVNEPDRAMKLAAMDALGALRERRAVDAGVFAAAMLINGSIERLVDGLNRPKAHDRSRGYLVEVVRGRAAILSRYVQDPSPRMRMDLADVIALADDPTGLPVVTPLVSDMDKQVAASAERTVAWLKAER